MKRHITFWTLITSLLFLTAFNLESNSTDDWMVGHFKATVDFGEGDRAMYMHFLNNTDHTLKTVIDNELGIGCTDEWIALQIDDDHVMLSNYNKSQGTSSCIEATRIELVNDGDDSIIASFYNNNDELFASAMFQKYAQAN